MIATKEDLAKKCNEVGISPNDLLEITDGILRLLSVDYYDVLESLKYLIEEINSPEWIDRWNTTKTL